MEHQILNSKPSLPRGLVGFPNPKGWWSFNDHLQTKHFSQTRKCFTLEGGPHFSVLFMVGRGILGGRWGWGDGMEIGRSTGDHPGLKSQSFTIRTGVVYIILLQKMLSILQPRNVSPQIIGPRPPYPPEPRKAAGNFQNLEKC